MHTGYGPTVGLHESITIKKQLGNLLLWGKNASNYNTATLAAQKRRKELEFAASTHAQPKTKILRKKK